MYVMQMQLVLWHVYNRFFVQLFLLFFKLDCKTISLNILSSRPLFFFLLKPSFLYQVTLNLRCRNLIPYPTLSLILPNLFCFPAAS